METVLKRYEGLFQNKKYKRIRILQIRDRSASIFSSRVPWCLTFVSFYVPSLFFPVSIRRYSQSQRREILAVIRRAIWPYHFFFPFFFYQNIVDLQCCASFRRMALWFSFMCVCACVCIYTYIHTYIYIYIYTHMLSHVRHFAALWAVACQAPLSIGFPRWAYWSGLPFPSPRYLPDPGIKPTSPASPSLQGDSLPPEPSGEPTHIYEFIFRFFSLIEYWV